MLNRILLSTFFFLYTFHIYAQKESIWFYPNQGQWHKDVLFKTPLALGDFYIDKTGFTYNLLEKSPLEHSENQIKRNVNSNSKDVIGVDVITTRFENANFSKIKKENRSKHYHNYFIGVDSTKWKSEIFGYKKLEVAEIYPNVSMLMEAKSNLMEYSFLIAPMQDPSVIKMRITGGKRSFIDSDGSLHVQYRFGEIIHRKPSAWTINPTTGKKSNVGIQFNLIDDIVQYKLDKYNLNHTLCIDPEIIFSSFSGSTADNRGFTATPDKNGNLIAGGVSFGMGYPTVTGSYNLNFNGGDSIYVDSLNNVYTLTHSAVDLTISKFNADGKDLLFSTYIGGKGNETPHSMVCNDQNDLYIFGATSSNDFPIPTNSYDKTFNGGKLPEKRLNIYFNQTDLYVLKLNEFGSVLKASTYIGGSKNDGINDSILRFNSGDEFRGEIIISHDNNVVVSSTTHSHDFPTKNAFQSNLKGFQDAVIFKFSSNLDNLIFSSYFGGENIETGNSVQSALDGTLYLAGGTNSSELTFANGNVKHYNGGLCDGYVLKLSNNNPKILAGTFIGASEYDQAFFVQIDHLKNIYIYGQSESNLPITTGKYGIPNSGQFISKFSNDLNTLQWNTTFGTGNKSVDISPTAFSVSLCGDIYISGWGGIKNRSSSKAINSTTIGLEVTNDAFQNETNGNNFYIAVLGNDAGVLSYATFMGGMSIANNHVDGGTSRFDKRGGIYHAVCAGCGSIQDGFSTTPEVFSPTNNATAGGCNLAAFEFDLKASLAKITTGDSAICLNGDVHFSNLSVNCDTYEWYFGDGEKSKLKEPIHRYKTPGKYTVKLIASNSKSICLLPDTTFTEVNVYNDYEKIIHEVASTCLNADVEISVLEGGVYHWKPDSLFLNNTGSVLKTKINSDVDIEVHVVKGCRTLDIVFPYKILKTNQSANYSYEVCKGNSIDLTVSGGKNYNWFPTNYLNTTSGNNVVCSPIDSITYFVTKTISNSCKTIDTIHVSTIDPTKQFFQTPTINLCPNESKVLTLKNGENLTFTPTTGIQKINNLKYILKPKLNTTYSVAYTNSCGVKKEEVRVNFFDPNFQLEKDTAICLNEKATIICHGGLYYKWLNQSDINYLKSDNSIATVTPKTSTKYTVVSIDSNQCVDTNSVLITVFKRPNLKIDYQYVANWGDNITLKPEVSKNSKGVFSWKPANILSCSDCQYPMITPDKEMQFSVYFTDTNQCTDSSKVYITFQSELYIPNCFTPNNDQKNDLFKPVMYNISDFTMYIYDRWGELIVYLSNQNDSWDGTYHGLPSPDDIYNWQVYYTDSYGNAISKRGHVSLLR